MEQRYEIRVNRVNPVNRKWDRLEPMSDTSRTSRTNGRPCSVCEHAERRNVETALLAGASIREVAQRYGLTKSTVARHQRLHLLPKLTAAESAVPARMQALENYEARLDVMAAMRELHARTLTLLTKAETSNDVHAALRAIREARSNLELLGRLDGSLDGPVAAPSGNVTVQVVYTDKAVIMPGAQPLQVESGEGD